MREKCPVTHVYVCVCARARGRVRVYPKGGTGCSHRHTRTHTTIGSISPIKALHVLHGPLGEGLVCPSVCVNMDVSVLTSSIIDPQAQGNNCGGSATGDVVIV